MKACRHIDVFLDLSPDQVLSYYDGSARSVVTMSLDGRTVRFPASVLPRIVTKDGARGIFRLNFSSDNRLIAVQPVAGEASEASAMS